MEAVHALAVDLFGTEGDIAIWQMALRAVVVYVMALALVRLGDKRLIGENAAFDFMLAIIIGSVVSRAITGNAPFWASMAASVALIGLHWALGIAGFKSDRLGTLLKGRCRVLIENGEVKWDQMRRSAIGEADLQSALRRNGGITDPAEVALACLERNGEISVIRRE